MSRHKKVTNGLVPGYSHPLRDWLKKHQLDLRELCSGAGVSRYSVQRVLQGAGCNVQTAARIIDWSWEVRKRPGLALEDLLPRPELRGLEYPVQSHWYQW